MNRPAKQTASRALVALKARKPEPDQPIPTPSGHQSGDAIGACPAPGDLADKYAVIARIGRQLGYDRLAVCDVHAPLRDRGFVLVHFKMSKGSRPLAQLMQLHGVPKKGHKAICVSTVEPVGTISRLMSIEFAVIETVHAVTGFYYAEGRKSADPSHPKYGPYPSPGCVLDFENNLYPAEREAWLKRMKACGAGGMPSDGEVVQPLPQPPERAPLLQQFMKSVVVDENAGLPKHKIYVRACRLGEVFALGDSERSQERVAALPMTVAYCDTKEPVEVDHYAIIYWKAKFKYRPQLVRIVSNESPEILHCLTVGEDLELRHKFTRSAIEAVHRVVAFYRPEKVFASEREYQPLAHPCEPKRSFLQAAE